MMARRTILAGLAGGMAALLAGCGLLGGNKYRFRMTVEVDTPQGLRSGSSVYEVEAVASRELITGGMGSYTRFRGEAVAVDLPGGKTLFALLRMANGTSADDHLGLMSMRAMDPALVYAHKDQSARRIAAGDDIRSPVEVAPEDYPLMVMFRDINDPRSVERVDPEAIGVKRIVLETTSDEVTTGIEKRLGWLRDGGLTLDPGGAPTTNPTFAQTIRQSEFSSEIPK